MPLPRRTVEEIITYHELEETLVDIYVEGSTDEDLLRWYFRQTNQFHVQVYSVDMIDVGKTEAVAGSSGNRQRLVTLAASLERKTKYGKVSCVCDRDFHQWVEAGADQTSDVLLLTDFACMEGYYLCTEVLEKFLALAIGSARLSGMQLLSALTVPLEECFLIRLVHTTLGWDLHWMTPERCCSVAPTRTIEFDAKDFIQRLLIKNGHSRDMPRFRDEMERLRRTFTGDARLRMHGHDFASLLTWYLKKSGHSGIVDADRLMRTLMACVREELLSTFPLFKSLDHRASIFGRTSPPGRVA
jgi:hypothetical protein